MTVPLPVTEFCRGEVIEEWDSITECARHHGVSNECIKKLIYYGDSFNTYTTFDIPCHCDMDLKLVGYKFVIFNTTKDNTRVQIREAPIEREPCRQGSLWLPEGVRI